MNGASDDAHDPATPPEQSRARSLHWRALADLLDELSDPDALRPDERGEALVSPEVRITLPRVLHAVGAARDPVAALREALEAPLPLHLVLLVQAGAVSLGLFDEGLVLETRTFKKYTVRAHGKAQATHLKRRGKSRYGSRLRLQNAENLLRQTHDKLRAWIDVYGRPEGLFYSAPVRLWPELFQARLRPAIAADAGWIRIQRDLPVPTTALLLRVYDELCLARVEPRSPST